MEYQFSDRLKNLSGNAIREIFKLLENPEVISFAGGMPATQCLPIAQIQAYVDELLSGPNGAKLLQYGSTEGYLPLRETMIGYVERGYENFEEKLRSLGAVIERVDSEKEAQKFRLRVG